MSKTIIYERVPTINQVLNKCYQNVDFPFLYYPAQLNMKVNELRRMALQRNWEVTQTIIEKKTGAKEGLNELLRAVTYREVDVVMVWAIDRLGRSARDLYDTMGIINNAGAKVYFHVQENLRLLDFNKFGHCILWRK